MINLDAGRPKAAVAWCAADDAAPDLRLETAAAGAGYRIIAAALVDRRVDLAVVDIRDAAGAIGDIATSDPEKQDLAKRVARARRLAPSAGIILLSSPGATVEIRDRLRRIGDICYVRHDPLAIVAAMREKLRLAALADEVGDRLKTLVAEGRSVDFSSLVDRPAERVSVLIAGKPSPLTLSACNAVRGAAAETTCVFSAGQVMRALDHHRFDGAILLPTDENDLLLALARALRRHHEHRRLPVILVSENEALLDRCTTRDGFISVLPAHLEPDLAHRFELTARRARLAHAMRSFLNSPESFGRMKSGAASARFFAAHALRLCQRADETEKPLSFVGVSLVAKNASAPLAGLSSSFDDMVRTAGRLVRAEDLIAKFAPGKIVIMMRDVRESDAQRAAARLEGVIAGTLDRAALERAEISASAIERRAGEDVESVIAGLIRRQFPGGKQFQTAN